MRIVPVLIVLTAALGLVACSEDKPEESVFGAQTQAIGKAEEANALIQQAADAQRRAIDEQGQ